MKNKIGRKIFDKALSSILIASILFSFMSAFLVDVHAVSYIKKSSDAHGSDYTDRPGLAGKLDEIFNGNINLYKIEKGKYKKVNAPLGCFYFDEGVECFGQNPYYDAWQCSAYAKAVYSTLFGELTNGANSKKVLGSGETSVTYSMFNDKNVRIGASIRTTDSKTGVTAQHTGHSMIVLKYDKSYIWYLEGNADDHGLVCITKCTWSEFNSRNRLGNGRYLGSVIQPTESFFNGKYKTECSISTNPASVITNITAKISASISSATMVKSYGYYLSKTQSDVVDKVESAKKTVSPSYNNSVSSISADVTGLTANSKYYYRMWAIIGSTTYYSDPVKDFSTTNVQPTMATLNVTTKDIGLQDIAQFSWLGTSNTDYYTVKIYDSLGSVMKTYDNIRDTKCSTNPFTVAGVYTAKITACNSSDIKVENPIGVTFTVHNDVTVEFYDTVQNKTIKNDIVHYGQSAIAPKSPSHYGYTFTRWDKDFNNVKSSFRVNTVYDANRYTVKFIDSITNQPIIPQQTVAYLNAAKPPEGVSPPSGYTFAGWDVDYTKIIGDTTVKTVYEWYDTAYPVASSISSISRNATKVGYDASVSVTAVSTLTKPLSGRVVVALKSSTGLLLTTTESSAFVLNAGEQKNLQVFVPFENLAYKVEVYVINNYQSGGIISSKYQQDIDNSSAWSEWKVYTGTVPVTQGLNGVSAVETKSVTEPTAYQYRFQTKTTATSYDTSLAGYTQNGGSWIQSDSGTIDYVAAWPAGFNKNHALYTQYNKTPRTASETSTTKTSVTTNNIGFIYWHWCYGTYTSGPINRAISWTQTGNFKTFHAFFSTTEKTYSTSADAIKFENASACRDTYWWNGLTSSTDGNLKVKRCSYTTYNKLFDYYKISDWSSWIGYAGVVPISVGSDTGTTNQTYYNIETRTVPGATAYYYRYKTTATVPDPSITSDRIVNINGTVDTSYAGKKAIVWVYKYGQTSDYTTEYISDEITIAANGSISLSNVKLLEAPSITTGDFMIAASIKGMTESVVFGKIIAPKPIYTVRFYNVDGSSIISEQFITEGSSATNPDKALVSIPAGYYFTNWSQSTVNVQSELSVYPEFEKEKYVVAFVDWGKQQIVLQEFEYGAELITPALEDAPNGYIPVWDLSNATQSEDGTYIVTSNTVVTVKYIDQMYSVKFLGYNDELNPEAKSYSKAGEQVLKYGELMDVPELNEENYIFFDWVNKETGETLSDTRVKENVTFIPHFIYDNTAQTPQASVETGEYDNEITVTLSSETENAKIFYTTDGNDPTEYGEEYTGPITISSSCVLLFYATAPLHNDSATTRYVYAVNNNGTRYHVVSVYLIGLDGDGYMSYLVEDGSLFNLTAYDSYYGYEVDRVCTDINLMNDWAYQTEQILESMILYVCFTPASFTVTFVDCNDNTVDEQQVLFCASAVEPAGPSRDGYRFIRWDDNDDYTCVTEDMSISPIYLPENEYATVSLNRSMLSIVSGYSMILKATISPENLTGKEMQWESSDETVAIVDAIGNIKALSAGTATITVTVCDSLEKAQCIVNVSVNLETTLCLKSSSNMQMDRSNGFLLRVAIDANKVSELRYDFLNTGLKFFDINGNVLTDDQRVGTGMVIKLMDGSNNLDEIIPVVTGDVNGDGQISALDALMTLQNASGITLFNNMKFIAGDINNSGDITALDALKMLQFASGLIVGF